MGFMKPSQITRVMAKSVLLHVASLVYVLVKSAATPELNRLDTVGDLLKEAYRKTAGWHFCCNFGRKVTYKELSEHADVDRGTAKMRYCIHLEPEPTSEEAIKQAKKNYATEQKMFKSSCIRERRENPSLKRRNEIALSIRDLTWRQKLDRAWTPTEHDDENTEYSVDQIRFNDGAIRFGYGGQKNPPGTNLIKERVGVKRSIHDRIGRSLQDLGADGGVAQEMVERGLGGGYVRDEC